MIRHLQGPKPEEFRTSTRKGFIHGTITTTASALSPELNACARDFDVHESGGLQPLGAVCGDEDRGLVLRHPEVRRRE
jgi:hypothetical protein